MPVVIAEAGFVVRIFGPPREHRPPHVHVEFGAEGVVVIRLGIGVAPPRVWSVVGMRDRDVLRAYRLVERHHDALLAAWREIHDQ